MDTQTGRPPLTRTDALMIASIVRGAQDESLIRRVDDRAPDGVVVGTARHLVTSSDTYALLTDAVDIRDALLRVTLRSGMDVCWPVSELIPQLLNGEARFAN